MARSSLAETLLKLDPATRRTELKALSHRQRRSLRAHWRLWAHEGQVAPAGPWHTWLIMAGRGFGKTRAFTGQRQKEFTVSEALAFTDSLLHPAIQGEAASPPSTPADGDCWLVAATPTDAWADSAGKIACRQAGAWLFVAPRDGLRVLDLSTGQDIRFQAGSWRRPVAPSTPTAGTTIDAEARTAIASLIDGLVAAGVLVAS